MSGTWSKSPLGRPNSTFVLVTWARFRATPDTQVKFIVCCIIWDFHSESNDVRPESSGFTSVHFCCIAGITEYDLHVYQLHVGTHLLMNIQITPFVKSLLRMCKMTKVVSSGTRRCVSGCFFAWTVERFSGTSGEMGTLGTCHIQDFPVPFVFFS